MLNIGLSLKGHRESAKLSQSQLAKATGIKQENLSRWEKGIHFPNIIDCITLASFYDISIDYLIGYENEDGTRNTQIIKDSFNINGNGNNISFRG